MDRTKVTSKKPDERVEPLYSPDCFEKKEIVGVAKLYVRLLVTQYRVAIMLIVIDTHHNGAEDAERSSFPWLENHGIAKSIGVAQAVLHIAHKRN